MTVNLGCSPFEIAAGLIFLAMLGCVAFGYGHHSRFVSYIEEHHPALWKGLAQRSKWLMPENGEYSLTGAQWFLIFCGEYKDIKDPRAKDLGRKARCWLMVTLTFMVILCFYALVAQNFPSLRCLIPWT